MSIRDDILDNRDFVIKALGESIVSEIDRVLTTKLATTDQLSHVILAELKSTPSSEDIGKKTVKLSSLYSLLKELKLPEDINKYAYSYTPSLEQFDEWEDSDININGHVSKIDPETKDWWTKLADQSLMPGKVTDPGFFEKAKDYFRDLTRSITKKIVPHKSPGHTKQVAPAIGVRGTYEDPSELEMAPEGWKEEYGSFTEVPSKEEFLKWISPNSDLSQTQAAHKPGTNELWVLPIGANSPIKPGEASEVYKYLEDKYKDFWKDMPAKQDMEQPGVAGVSGVKRGTTDVLINSVDNFLKKLARSLEDNYNHEAIYLVERTIRDISSIK